MCIKRLVPNVNKDVIAEPVKLVPEDCAKTIIRKLKEYYEAKKIDENVDEDYDDKNIDMQNTGIHTEEAEIDTHLMEEEEDSKTLPTHIQMVEDVLKCCLHFLPSKDTKQSFIAMLTLEEGLLILMEWENQLLPIVHQLWHPLVDRFKDQNVLVINRAWQLFRVLARVSNDFIRSRTLKQVLPALSNFLSNSAKESYNKDIGTAYKFTQIYKLQKELLSGLSQIVKDLKLHEKEMWDILSITESYLNARQHPTLQNCCINLYKDVADYNSDVVWVKCLSIWDRKIAKIPTDEKFNLECLKVTDCDFSRNEYLKNVETILTYIHDKFSQL